jgi:PAS domain S-box-containing protein
MNDIESIHDKFNPGLNRLHEGVWILDKEFFTTFVNKVCVDALGYLVVEMIGKHFFSFLDKSNISDFAQKLEQLKNSSEEIVDLTFIKKSGVRFIAHLKLTSVFSVDGNFVGIKSTFINNFIENSKKNIIDLDKVGIDKLFYESPMGIYLTSPNGRLYDVNDAFLKLIGYSKDEFFNMPIQNLTHPADREADLKFANRIFNDTCDEYEIEKRFLKKNGDTLWVKMFVKAIRDSQLVLLYTIVMVKDITSEKELQEKLVANERLAKIGEMVSHLSHAIKSPLSVIGMNVDFLKHQCADKNCFNPILPIVQNELKHIDYLIQEVLIYSRHNNLHCINFNIREKVENIITEMHPILETQNIKIINNINDKIINADAQKIYSLLLTLIDNSIEAIGQNGTIEFFSEYSDRIDFIDIFIRDTGGGFIDPENAFKPFYTTKSTGTGMGLPIAKNLVQDHKGSIELLCAEPGDTIIKFSLPLAE